MADTLNEGPKVTERQSEGLQAPLQEITRTLYRSESELRMFRLQYQLWAGQPPTQNLIAICASKELAFMIANHHPHLQPGEFEVVKVQCGVG